MQSSWLQQTRFPLESIQAIERAIVELIRLKQDSPKDAIIIDHKINIFLSMIQEKANLALQFLKDDEMRSHDISVIGGLKNLNATDKGRAPLNWHNYYEKMKELRNIKHNPVVEPPENTVQYFNSIVFKPPYKEPSFSNEEAKGRYVDMHTLYVECLNLSKVMTHKNQELKFGDYLWYLQNFDSFDEMPMPAKLRNQAKYKTYLNNLLNYLRGCYKRIRPLEDHEEFQKQIDGQFEQRFEKGMVAGWEDAANTQQDRTVYCSDCRKVFLNEETFVNHLNGKKHLKAASQREAGPTEEEEAKAKQQHALQQKARRKQIAQLEHSIASYRQQLAGTIYDTMNLIRKKQTRGYEEQEQQNQQQEESEADPDEPVYNPKNLPLGWDGKPIPYWLYKLHGLGIEYKCQICGNYSYWGRRAFQMHFQEWRHTYGMKCLRIPNTVHFKDVTSINDAIALHQKLLSEAEGSQFRPEVEEEFEDTEGNIINKKTYNDMKKQGIL